ncbi:UNVERIFIED_ORG: hypothetical protein J2X79_004651 [Arthrobacter globiformis]|nr:hypothetical protein [Arthrobacter globiformis]
MFGRAHALMKGQDSVRESDEVVPAAVGRRGRRPGNGSRIGWIVAGILAVAVTLTVVVREVLNRAEDPDAERTGEESVAPALLPTRESM